MTNDKKVSIGKVAGISLLSVIMMFAAAAPGMTQAHAGIGPVGDITKILTGTDAECFTGITIAKTTTTNCQFQIFYIGDPAIVEDTVPAEFEVTNIQNLIGDCTSESTGKKDDKSATKIICDETGLLLVLVDVSTRESPSTVKHDDKEDKFKPTSCGELDLNDGAIAYASAGGEKILVDDGFGNLVPIEIDSTEPITLDAVDPDDLDCDGVPNEDDLCPDTPLGTEVDIEGCPLA